MDSAQHVRRFGHFRPPIVVLIAPAIVLAAVPILIGLLGIFIVWLIGVGSLIAAILVFDLIRRLLQPATRAGAGKQAIGAPRR